MDKRYVITIARGYGSGGRTIGKMLASQLGINYYDKEILKLASDTSGISESVFDQADENLKSTTMWKIAKNVYRGEKFSAETDDFASNINLFNYQARVLSGLAQSESFVAIGRCADYILKNSTNLVSIFVHASMEHCIDSISNVSSLAPGDIEQFISQTDRHRADYYRYYTGKEWMDARNYDLCLNTDDMTLQQCVDMITSYMKIRYIL